MCSSSSEEYWRLLRFTSLWRTYAVQREWISVDSVPLLFDRAVSSVSAFLLSVGWFSWLCTDQSKMHAGAVKHLRTPILHAHFFPFISFHICVFFGIVFRSQLLMPHEPIWKAYLMRTSNQKQVESLAHSNENAWFFHNSSAMAVHPVRKIFLMSLLNTLDAQCQPHSHERRTLYVYCCCCWHQHTHTK